MKVRFGIFFTVLLAALSASYATATLRAQDPAAPPAPAAGPTPGTPAEEAAAKSTWDSIYSQEQATRGEVVYNQLCIRCHGAEAMGADAPALTGADFNANWDALSVAELFDRIRNTMPQDDPQSMSREDTAAVLAYMFTKSSFPAGSTPLPSDGDLLARIKYLANKP
jgi:mono/diheme cytochrome c family protein